MIEVSKAFFKQNGYTLGVDWPYRGAIVPLNHYQKSKNVQAVMLEINRALYLNEPGNEKSSEYPVTKEITNEYLKTIKAAFSDFVGI